MADACSLASYRQLAWTAGWHLREDTYRPALTIVAEAQQHQPLAALFGAPNVSSSDGQHFPSPPVPAKPWAPTTPGMGTRSRR